MLTAGETIDTAQSTRQPLILVLQARAIDVGLLDGELALKRASTFMVLRLFASSHVRPLADPQLEAVRAYAEMARVLWAQGRGISSEPLERIGFTPAEINAVERILSRRLASL